MDQSKQLSPVTVKEELGRGYICVMYIYTGRVERWEELEKKRETTEKTKMNGPEYRTGPLSSSPCAMEKVRETPFFAYVKF